MDALKVPPRAALVGATALVVPIVLVAVATGFVGGPAAGLGVAVGALAGLQVAVTAVGWRVRAAVVVLALLAVAAGLSASANPWLSGLAALAFGIVQASLNRRSAGLAVMLPVLVAVTASLPQLATAPLALSTGVVIGATAVCAATAVLSISTPPEPIPRTMAWRHAVAVGVTAGAVTATVVALDLRHGYWMVLVLAFVLRPSLQETADQGRDRFIGTVVGLIVALALVLVLPTAAALALAAVCSLLAVAYALTKDLVRQTLFGMPGLVLLASSGLADRAVGVAAERLVFTVVAIVLAGATAYVLRRLDEGGDRAPSR
ncbi:MAG: FUSC family protein [Dermatophilaceae bacterium]